MASTDQIARYVADQESFYGEPRRFDGSTSSYLFCAPRAGLQWLDGVLPSLIDRLGNQPSFPSSSAIGCSLISFEIEHPKADEVAKRYKALDIRDAPRVARGEDFRYTATIQTPTGPRLLF